MIDKRRYRLAKLQGGGEEAAIFDTESLKNCYFDVIEKV